MSTDGRIDVDAGLLQAIFSDTVEIDVTGIEVSPDQTGRGGSVKLWFVRNTFTSLSDIEWDLRTCFEASDELAPECIDSIQLSRDITDTEWLTFRLDGWDTELNVIESQWD